VNKDSNARTKDIQDDEIINKSGKKSRIISIIFIIILFFGLWFYMVKVDGIDNMKKVIESANIWWFIAGLICLIGQWICESLEIHIPIKKMYPDNKFSTSFQVNIIGQLFNNITPFSSGGQPMQAYLMSKTGKRASDVLSVLMVKFILYQLALFTDVIVLMIIKFNFFKTTFGDYIWLVALGFVMNIIATLFILLCGRKKEVILKIARPLIRLGSKIQFGKHKLVKDADRTIEKFEESCENYSNQFKRMNEEKAVCFKVYLVSVAHHLVNFAIPYMVYRAFGNNGTSFVEVLMVQSLLLLIMSFIPTPGSGLGAEGGFALFYGKIFTKETLHMGILFWRIYVFYLPIIVGALFLIPTIRRDKKKVKTVNNIDEELLEE
jgi:uncharacterized protein (TIRG00374 family)